MNKCTDTHAASKLKQVLIGELQNVIRQDAFLFDQLNNIGTAFFPATGAQTYEIELRRLKASMFPTHPKYVPAFRKNETCANFSRKSGGQPNIDDLTVFNDFFTGLAPEYLPIASIHFRRDGFSLEGIALELELFDNMANSALAHPRSFNTR